MSPPGSVRRDRGARARVSSVVVAAVVVGLLAGAAAGLVAASRPAGWTASTTVALAAGPASAAVLTGPDATEAAATVVGLTAGDGVRDAVAADTGTTPADVADRLTAVDTGEGSVRVTGTAATADAASALLASWSTAVSADLGELAGAATARTLAPLLARTQALALQLAAVPAADPARAAIEREYAALDAAVDGAEDAAAVRLLPGTPPVTAPVPGDPWPAALVVGALAFLVTAALGALARRAGRGPSAGAARRLAAPVPGASTTVRFTDDVPAVLTRFYALVVRGKGRLHVVQLTDPSACDLARELVLAAGIVGDDLTHHDLTPDAPPPDEPARLPAVGAAPAGAEVHGLRRPRVDGPALAVLRDAGAAVLVVDTAHGRPAVVADAVAMLEGLGVEVRGVIVWEGRIPRDPAWGHVGGALVSS